MRKRNLSEKGTGYSAFGKSYPTRFIYARAREEQKNRTKITTGERMHYFA